MPGGAAATVTPLTRGVTYRCAVIAIGVPALDLPTTENVSLLTAVSLLAVAALCAWLIKKIVAKTLTVVVIVGLAVVIWTQRTSLQDCADTVRDNVRAGSIDNTTCTFFGQDVTVKDGPG